MSRLAVGRYEDAPYLTKNTALEPKQASDPHLWSLGSAVEREQQTGPQLATGHRQAENRGWDRRSRAFDETL